MMTTDKNTYGIAGAIAPELRVDNWVDGTGKKTEPIRLSDYEGKYKVIYGFQSWCPGCHSRGLPALKRMVDALEGSDKVAFFAIQTVFEGKSANTFEKLLETQKEYNLAIPFGQDEGDETSGNRSFTMNDYRTGGTPWFIIIDDENRVLFNDFHLNDEKAIEIFKAL